MMAVTTAPAAQAAVAGAMLLRGNGEAQRSAIAAGGVAY